LPTVNILSGSGPEGQAPWSTLGGYPIDLAHVKSGQWNRPPGPLIQWLIKRLTKANRVVRMGLGRVQIEHGHARAKKGMKKTLAEKFWT